MNRITPQVGAKRPPSRTTAVGAAATLACAGMTSLCAMEISPQGADLQVRWDNTLKYSAAARVKERMPAVVANYNPNLDDGDRNFDRGLISNRFDLLSELDVVYKGTAGLRLSGAAWYDDVYHKSNDNPGPAGGATPNNRSVAYNEFTRGTRKLHGGDAEVLDAFVFGKADVGDMALSGRLGKHTVLWGESLFFGDNGIAGTQAPVDMVKALTVPGSQFKEIILPVNQVSGQLQVSPTLSLGAYLQFEWKPTRVPGAGSYLSRTDIFDAGGEFIYLPPQLGGPLARAADIEPSDHGQGGLQLRWRSEALDTEFGFYATRFHSKSLIVNIRPGRDYRLAYHEGVRAFGVSASTSIGTWNVGAEASVRRNASLVADGGKVIDPTGTGDNHDNPLYPVGNSAHLQISGTASLERTSLWDSALVLAEIAWNRRTSITRNSAALDPGSTRDAVALRVRLIPTWFQVLPGLDLSAPVTLGYNPDGRSSVITSFNGGWSKAGDLSLGLNFEYEQAWKGGITYTHYIGSAGGVQDQRGGFTFAQSLRDRNFVALSLQRSF